MATQVRCARIAKKPTRTATLVTRFESGVLLVVIAERTAKTCKLTHCYVESIPADFGRGFRFEKFACQSSEVYAVNVGDENEPASCECLGHLRHGQKTVCRHIAAAKALIDAGKVA